MAIICDICSADCTPDKCDPLGLNGDDMKYYTVLEFNGSKVCMCDDCYFAVSEWIGSEECKEYCKKKIVERQEEMGE